MFNTLMRAFGVVVFNVVLDAFTQFLDIIGGIDFSLSILSFSKKHITLHPHLVLPLIDIIYEATELRWERSENLRHYPML